MNRLCPVVGSYPEKDFTASAGRALYSAGIEHDIKVYPGARHAFFNDRGRAYDKAAAEDSWRRVLSFFGDRLKAPAKELAP